jgi:hypothetical protein
MPKVRRVDVEVRPRVLEAPYGIELVGRGWGSCPIRLTIAGGAPTRLRVLLGEPRGELVRPLGGEFVAVADVPGLQVGEHTVRAVSTGHAVKESAETTLEPIDIPGTALAVASGYLTARWLHGTSRQQTRVR